VPVAPLEVTEGDRESLLTALGRVPDPRDPRGVRYQGPGKVLCEGL